MAAGTAANYAGAQKSKKAMDEMQLLENERQKKHQGRSDELLNESLSRSGAGKAEADIQDAASKRQTAYEQVLPPPSSQETTLSNQLGVSADNRVIGAEVAAQNTEAGNRARNLASSLASIGGLSDQNLMSAILNNRSLQQQQQVGNFMQGSAGVLPFEMDAASRKGDNLKGIGDILNAAAMVTGTMAATGYNPFASAPVPVYTPGQGMPLYKTAAVTPPPSNMSHPTWGGFTTSGQLNLPVRPAPVRPLIFRP
jgi:hypothetical protein